MKEIKCWLLGKYLVCNEDKRKEGIISGFDQTNFNLWDSIWIKILKCFMED